MKVEQQIFDSTHTFSAGAERRQTVAHGVSRGYRAPNITSPGGAKESVAPSEAWFAFLLNPTACAVGYHLSPFHG